MRRGCIEGRTQGHGVVGLYSSCVIQLHFISRHYLHMATELLLVLGPWDLFALYCQINMSSCWQWTAQDTVNKKGQWISSSFQELPPAWRNTALCSALWGCGGGWMFSSCYCQVQLKEGHSCDLQQNGSMTGLAR